MTVQPQQFIEIGEALAKEKGIEKGDWVKVSSKRGWIVPRPWSPNAWCLCRSTAKPCTKSRTAAWRLVNVSGEKQFIVNTLTPFVGDCNTQTPEYKTFLVNIEKA